MKYLDEFRDPAIVDRYLQNLHQKVTRPWSIMEICGGQTHSLVKNGILDLLPSQITMVHGPGCPVCVTPTALIDQAIAIASMESCTICSFGDMLRVPGSRRSLLKAKSDGADVRIVYSPMDAVRFAQANPGRQVVFFAVGFETTAPANALSVLQARQFGLTNYFILSSHVLVPPAMEALLADEETKIHAFLAAGHVCTVMGTKDYETIAKKYKAPIVVTGFEPVDLLKGLYHCVLQLEQGKAAVENQYARVVSDEGNRHARNIVEEVFEITDREWRGIGVLPQSGLNLRAEFRHFDASVRFAVSDLTGNTDNGCVAGEILKGIRKPSQCPQFGNACTPQNPLGAPMVSSEGACAAYYNYSH
jgi:hydrogenase expression/formation protein HypD